MASAKTIGITNSPERALGPYIGFGHTECTLSSNNDVLGTQSSDGVILYAGFPFNKWVALEIIHANYNDLEMNETPDRPYPRSTTAEYSFVARGLKLNLARDKFYPFVPWLQVGLSNEQITWDEYWYSVTGSGSFVGLGVEWYPSMRHSLLAEYQTHSFSGQSDAYISDDFMIKTDLWAISYTYHFKRYGF
jgi:hypothetical protein